MGEGVQDREAGRDACRTGMVAGTEPRRTNGRYARSTDGVMELDRFGNLSYRRVGTPRPTE